MLHCELPLSAVASSTQPQVKQHGGSKLGQPWAANLSVPAMPGGDEVPEDRPFVRWPSIIHPAASAYLPLPVPAPPTRSSLLGADELQEGAVADVGALADVISALQAVNVSYL